MGIPACRERSSPPLDVVHLEPGQVGRARNDGRHIFLGITQAKQEVPPHAFVADGREGQVHPVQRHPVQLPFPTVPVPESHRIGVGAVVEIVHEIHLGRMPFGLRRQRQHLWKRRAHPVPAQMDPAVVFQVPVQAHGDVDVIVAPDDGFPTAGVDLEEGFRRRNRPDDNPFRGARIYAFQHVGYGIRRPRTGGREQGQEEDNLSHNLFSAYARKASQS